MRQNRPISRFDPASTGAKIITAEQADLIRRSFDAIWAVRRKFAAAFYRQFFERAPDAEALFKGDMERQHLQAYGHDRCAGRRAR
jgi:hypothetical protein